MRKLGKYEILEEVGRGGFAVVYKARDAELNRLIALKVLRPQLAADPEFIQRFRQEAQTAAGLCHSHIVTIYDVGEEAGQHYLAMAFLSGRTLDKWLAEGPLPVEQAVSIVEQVASALDTIHGQGLVHRDVKPANIMVDEAGQATLLDFGIARAAEGTQLTTTGVLGTPEYMSPEQAEGQKPDAQSDVYSLGVVTYERCVGQVPFSAPTPLVVLRLQADKEPPSPRELNPHLTTQVEQVLLKALRKDRKERYESAGKMAQALREAVDVERRARQQDRRVKRPSQQGRDASPPPEKATAGPVAPPAPGDRKLDWAFFMFGGLGIVDLVAIAMAWNGIDLLGRVGGIIVGLLFLGGAYYIARYE